MTNAELTQKFDTLQATIDAEQQEIANALQALSDENQTLRDQIAAGASPEQLQAHADRVDAIIADVQETIPNLPEPEPPVEPTE